MNVWPFKKKIIPCNHHFSDRVGFFYKETFSEYRNCFDYINVYVRYKCDKCGERKNVFLAAEEYVPELYNKRDPRKDEFIKKLQSLGCVQEHEIMMLEHKDEK